jgi:hypothetical protein
LVLSGMGRNASFRSGQRAQRAPEGLGERVSNGLNQLGMMSYQMNSEIRTLSADMQGTTLAAWEQYVRARVVDIRKLFDDVDRTKSDYEAKLEAARKVLEDFERCLNARNGDAQSP